MNDSNEIIIKMAATDSDYEYMRRVRKAVFVEEQGIPEEKEFDGNDHHASHVIAYVKKDGYEIPVGTMRIRYFSGFAKFERMAVLKAFRKSDVSSQIMDKGFDFVGRKGFTKVYGMCKKELLHRWQKCGYQEIEGSKHVFQNGMELIPIGRTLEPHPKAIKINDYPDLLTAAEDFWDLVKIPEGNEPKVPAWLESQKKSKISAVILRMRNIKSKS